MALEAVLPVFVEIIKAPVMKYIVGPVVRHAGYAFRSDNKVQKLGHEVAVLGKKMSMLQQTVGDATNKGEKIKEEVTRWLTDASKDIEEAEEIIKGSAEAMNKCFGGLCPNLKARYQLSKKAHKKALAVGKHLQDAQALPDPISYLPPLQQIVTTTHVNSSEALLSRVEILNQIMDDLKDPKLKMIGVYGMGGVGKTTLAKEVVVKAREEKTLFNNFVHVTVSQTPNLIAIQRKIAGFLELKLDSEDTDVTAAKLHQRLKNDKSLIILDDVWEKLDLNEVGIPYGEACEGCKILLTSRSREVLSNQMLTQKNFSLQVLDEEETWRLFEKSVGNITDPDLRPLAMEIAKQCSGLPLLILKVAADLRGKESYAWKDMSKRLSSLENAEIYEKVHKVIESSFHYMGDVETKSIFLLCALFGDSNIEIHKLLIYSVGLELFKGINTIDEARNRVLALIDKLKDGCLLMDSDRDGFVKIHDVVRDVALRVQHVYVRTDKVRSRDFPNKDWTRISLPYCDISELPGVLECPEVEVFSLFSYQELVDIPSSFFDGVPKLKVVDIYGVCFKSGLPSLRGLRTLCLRYCKFNNVAIVAELTELEILSFASSNIEELPGEIKRLTQLKLLDLEYCNKLRVIPADVLSNLSSLEELYMLDSFSGWGDEGNASLVELKNLSYLKTLEIRVKDDKSLPEDWFFNGVQNYRIFVGQGAWNWLDDNTSKSRRVLKLELESRSMGSMHKIKEFVRGIEVLELRNMKVVENLLYDFGKENTDSFGKLQILTISHCDTLKSLFSPSIAKYLLQLQKLKVNYCKIMESIVDEGCGNEVIKFPQLNSLELSNLPNLISFCKTSGMVSFPKLTTLRIEWCERLKYVFTNSMVKSLEQLKELRMKRCRSLEEIILSEEIEEESINRIVFPKLDYLKLNGLAQLKRFSNNVERVDEYLFHDMVHFPNLEHLHIREIDSKYVFHESVARGLLQLRKLKMRRCGAEMIIGNAQEETTDIEWPNLKHLKVVDCQKLIKFKSNNFKVSFPSLTTLDIHNCNGLEYVFTSSMACGLLQLRELKIRECGAEVIIGNLEEETIGIKWPNLRHLEVENCHKLIKFGSNNSKLFPKVEVLELDDHSFKAIQSDGLPVDFPLKMKQVSLNRLRVKGSISEMLFGFLRRINSLERLRFWDCCLELDCIISPDDEKKYHLTLEHLELSRIISLKHILKKDSQLNPVLQHLKSLYVRICGDLMNIAPSSASFKNLTTLRLEDCKKMTSLVTASTAKTMVLLEELRVYSCAMMEEVVARDDMAENDGITFKNLKVLSFIGLARLNCFCSGNYEFNFPLLEQVSVIHCSTMKFFCNGILSSPKLHGIELNYQTKQWEGDLNATIGSQFRTWVGEPIPPNELKHLRRLEKLIVRDCKWVEVVFDLEGAHVGLLPELSELQLINLPKLTQLRNRAPRDNLDFNNLRKLKIDNCCKLEYALTTSMSSCLSQLYIIQVTNCEMLKTIIMEEDAIDYSERSDFVFCPSLKMLTVVNCPIIKAFISRRTMDDPDIHLSSKAFSSLEELVLDIKSFKAILQFELPSNFFSKVKKLGLEYLSSCSTTILYVPLFHFLSMAFNLNQLEVCHSSVKELFDIQGLNIKFREEAMMTLSRIRELKLFNLDDLKQIWCQHSEFYASLFQNLRQLEVDGCNQLRYVMTSSVAKSLFRLETLRVKSSTMLTEIVGDGDGTTDDIIFPEMKNLELSKLQSLKSFSSRHSAFQFPCLEKVIVCECPNLRIFCPGIILTPMLHDVKCSNFDFGYCDWEGNLNTTIEHIYNLLVGFQSVEDVKLSMFPALKEKWAAHIPFAKLYGIKRLEVDDCAQFTSAISSHFLPHLSNLEVLIVFKCDSLIQVFDLENVAAYRCSMKLNELQLIDLPSLRNVWSKDPRKLLSFENLQVLKIQNCGNLTFIFNLSIASSLPNLQHLEVINCSLVKYIISKEEGETMMQYQMIFSSLKTMILKYLTMLSSFYSTNGLLECPSLKSLEIVECQNMELSSSTLSKVQDSCSMTVEKGEEKIGAQYGDSVVPLLGNTIVIPLLEELKVESNYMENYLKDHNLLQSRLRFIDLTGCKEEYAIVPSNLLQNFPNLERLTLSDASMEEMNLDELSTFNEKHNDSVGLSIKLKLSNLTNLKHLVRDDSQLVPLFQILAELELCECSRLQILVPSSVSFQNLTALEVSKCDGMKNLISSSTARSLVQLRRIKVRDCETLQEIVAVESDQEEYNICFSQLENLELDELPCLTSFCSGNYVFQFPSLEEVVVKECPNMKTFAEKIEITPKLKKVKTGRREYEWEWEGSLDNTIHSLFIDKGLKTRA